MIKTIGNLSVELSGSLIQIKDENGMTFRAEHVSGQHAVDRFNEVCRRVETYVNRTKK